MHTPGPWTYDVSDDGTLLDIKAGDEWILNGCGCCGSPWVSNVEDARLMAAAPDLLYALQEFIRNPGGDNTEQIAEDAINKALGENK